MGVTTNTVPLIGVGNQGTSPVGPAASSRGGLRLVLCGGLGRCVSHRTSPFERPEAAGPFERIHAMAAAPAGGRGCRGASGLLPTAISQNGRMADKTFEKVLFCCIAFVDRMRKQLVAKYHLQQIRQFDSDIAQ